MGRRAAGHGRRQMRWRDSLPWLLLIGAGVWAYRHSFGGAFLFDDRRVLAPLLQLDQLDRPLWEAAFHTSRPLTVLSFALNYAVSGLRPWSYHAVNLLIHLLASLTLFGIVRRTLQLRPLAARFSQHATGLALSGALLWLLHPLQTQAVTYVVQRAESLAGLWALLVLYALIRSEASTAPARWHALAIAACALGMLTKPTMAVAPVAAWCYDRALLAGSFREALRRRRVLYAGLAATWLLLAGLLLAAPDDYRQSAGFGLSGVTPWRYLLTQPGVILHYLRLAAWPHPLVLDYSDWPLVAAPGQAIVPLAVIGALLAATGWAMRHHPALGFLGAWFFLTLVPSSSIIPIHDVAFEHRMYLPLAALMGLGVLGAHRLNQRVMPPARRRAVAVGLLAVLTVSYGVLTVQRNADYRSEVAIWRDVIAKRSGNWRAHNNLGVLLASYGALDAAARHYHEALRLKPDYADAHNNLGNVLARQGDLRGAVRHYDEALRFDPDHADARRNRETALRREG